MLKAPGASPVVGVSAPTAHLVCHLQDVGVNVLEAKSWCDPSVNSHCRVQCGQGGQGSDTRDQSRKLVVLSSTSTGHRVLHPGPLWASSWDQSLCKSSCLLSGSQRPGRHHCLLLCSRGQSSRLRSCRAPQKEEEESTEETPGAGGAGREVPGPGGEASGRCPGQEALGSQAGADLWLLRGPCR